jgi:prepilin-type processing-associated H-X9-DG protein/prepilin-type N-terminal cleavage/methylation domain-containing protein
MQASRYGRRERRRAFTIVELLVVITIIAMLVAIVLPAVNSVRESAQRSACAQRQTSLALAMAAFNVRQERLPEAQNILGLTSLSFPSHYTQRVVAWQVVLLPYLERNDLFTNVSADRGWNDMDRNAREESWLDPLTCPSSVPSVKLYSLIHYFANCGTGLARDDGVLVGTGYAPTARPNPFPSPRPPYPPPSPGPPAMSLDDIKDRDGLASTLLIAEMTRSVGGSIEWNRDLNCNTTNPMVQDKSVFGWPIPFNFATGNPCFGMPGNTPPVPVVNNSNATYTPFSKHPGGANVAFCDGHVRFLKDTLPGYLYAHMVTSRSVYNGTTGTTPYDGNSSRANTWLRASPAPVPYSFAPQDLD